MEGEIGIGVPVASGDCRIIKVGGAKGGPHCKNFCMNMLYHVFLQREFVAYTIYLLIVSMLDTTK